MSRLIVALLGQFQARLEGQVLTAFESDRVRALLAYLMVEADRPHARETLAGLLWPEQTAQAARANLSHVLLELRRTIDDREAVPAFLLISRQTLQFNPASDYQLDVATFSAHLASSAAHPHASLDTCSECLQRLAHAAELYKGNFLAGLSLPDGAEFEHWLLVTQEQLHRQALETLYKLADAYERRGDFERARHYAWRQTALEPWREEAHAQLMRALALSGQPSAALAQYETCRRILREELGVAPMPETTALYERIRQGELTPATLNAPLPRQNLPVHLTPFVGREAELAELAACLAQPEVRLLTLVGPGGMGKTRLAVEAARARLHAVAQDIFFVSLAPLTTAASIVPSIAATLGLNAAGSDPRQTLLQAVRNKQMLLILDNFEHLLDGVGIVTDILQIAPQVQIMATSRAHLNVRGEHVYSLHALDYAPNATLSAAAASSAVRLFLQSARRSQSNLKLSDENLGGVLRICQLVQGMPLGLEMAAAWTQMLSPGEIAEEIQRSIDFLAFEWHDAPQRQRSMRAVFDWSWGLLNEAERQVFRELSVFRGGFTRNAAQAVTGTSLLVLTHLVHKSLLQRSEAQGASAGRYEIHELLRQFAAEKLTGWQSSATTHQPVQDRHLVFFLDLAEKAAPQLEGTQQDLWMVRLEAEHDNLRTALHWAVASRQVAAALRLSCALFSFWNRHIYLDEGLGWLKQALAFQVQDAPVALLTLRMKAFASAAYLALGLSDYEQSAQLAQESLTFARRLDAKHDIAYALVVFAGALRGLGDYTQARSLFAESLTLCRTVGHQHGIGTSLANLGILAWLQGDHNAAARLVEEGLAVFQTIGEDYAIAHLQGDLAVIRLGQGDLAAAQGLAQAYLTSKQAYSDKQGVAEALYILGDVAASLGDLSEAQMHYRQSLTLLKQYYDRWHIALVVEGLAGVAATQAEATRAARLSGATTALRDTARLPLPPVFQVRREHTLVAARSHLGDECFSAAWQVGRAMTLEQLTAYALSLEN